MDNKTDTVDLVVTGSLVGFVLFSVFSISLAQACATAGGIAWLWRICRDRAWGGMKWPLGIPFLLFVLACILSVATAVDIGRSVKPLKKVLEILIFFWAVNCVGAARPGAFFVRLVKRLPSGGLKDRGERLAARLETVSPREFFLFLLLGSVSMASLYGFYQAWTHGVSTSSRVGGSLSIYMTFAGILMLVGLVAASRLLFAKGMAIWVGAALGVIVVCLFLTLTRQAWVGFLAGLAILLYVRKRILVLALPLLALLAVALSPGAVQERLKSFANLKDATFLTRVALWRGGWAIFKDHPLTGCGFKCVDSIYEKYPEHVNALKRYKGMHNNVVQLAVDTGIAGLSAWLSIWIYYFLSLYRLRETCVGLERWILLGCGAAIAGFLTGGMFEVNFYDSEVVMLTYFLMGLPFAHARPQPVSWEA
ncbi:MAG: O-antigen ligase family protein [Nitrospinae bacterium]|nr:O-antigen ligase family protein [Nitrospinota bacterium]